MDLDFLSGEVLDSAIRIHRRYGPGLLESVYEVLLTRELQRRGLRVERQKAVPLELDGVRFEEALRLDLLVEQAVVVEVKAVDRLAPAHWKQVLTYLRLMDLRLGLLINFGGATLKEGCKASGTGTMTPLPGVLGVKRPSDARMPEDQARRPTWRLRPSEIIPVEPRA